VKIGPGHKITHVTRRHAERVRHHRREVRRALPVQDPGQGGQQEAVGSILDVEAGAQE
jgi:hypothetical protein